MDSKAESSIYLMIISYLLENYEKIAIKQFSNGNIYVKIYSPLDNETIQSQLASRFCDFPVTIEDYLQDPPFIEDKINALEVMISFDNN